jgi:response regulator RpfG family c-di-GMP phosphodiesterase
MSQSLEAKQQLACAELVDSPHATGGVAASPRSSEKDARRLLIVDDEQNILSSLRRLLRRESYELVTASSAEEALQAMEEQPADVVISDYRMPGMTGTELLREIQNRWPDTVRIVLSGYSEVNAIIAAINEGWIYKFITKPWNDEEILLSIKRAVEQYELVAENKRMAREIHRQNEQLRNLNKLLDQRATDASTGLTCAQEFFETIDAGLLAVDTDGLIVSANLRAAKLMSKDYAECIGVPADAVLPQALQAALPLRNTMTAGRFTHDGRDLQWRIRALETDGVRRATVITIWEDIPCQPA